MDEIAENATWADAGKLVGIADPNDDGGIWKCREKICRELDINHRSFIEDEDVAFQLVPRIECKMIGDGIPFEEAVDGLCWGTDGFAHTFGSAACWGGENHIQLHQGIDFDEGADDGCFADAGSACDDGKFILEGAREGFVLLDGEGEARVTFPPSDGAFFIEWTKLPRRIENCFDARGGLDFGKKERTQIDAARGICRGGVGFGNDALFGDFFFEGLGEDFNADACELVAFDEEFVFVSPAMAGVIGFGFERVGNGGAGAKRRIFWNANGERDAVGRRETNAPDVAAKFIGVGLDDGDGVGSITANNLRHLCDADAVGLTEDHVLAHRFVGVPTFTDLCNFCRAEFGNFGQACGLMREDVEGLFAEGLDDAMREDFANAADEARGEIAFDAIEGFWREAGDGIGFELFTVNFVDDPLAFGADVFAFPDGLCFADDGDFIQTA